MFSRFVLLCALIPVITAKPVLDRLKENSNHPNNVRRLKPILAVFEKFVQQSSAVQQFGATRSTQTHQYLASLPSKCQDIGHRDDEEMNLLLDYYKCNLIEIVEDITSVGLYSAKYIYNTYRDSSVIVGDLLACTSAGLNPFTFVYCIFKAVEVLPAEIKDIIALAKDYENTMDILIPRIYQGIDYCFNKTSIEYDTYLNNILVKANACKNNIVS